MKRMKLQMGQVLAQRLEQRLELQLGIGLHLHQPDFQEFLSGSKEDLLLLLKTNKQVDKEDKLNYLVSGGWAIEMLTGKKREHHDLDVISISEVPLTYSVDNQEPENYFGVFSVPGEKMASDYTQKVTWERRTVYVPTNEFLLLSKLAGFMRQPRDKDLHDIEAISQIITPDTGAQSEIESLLHFIPGIHKDFMKNTILYSDLSEKIELCEDAYKLCAEYICEIVENFKKGKKSLASRQSAQLHETLKSVYEEGLKDSFSTKNLVSYEKLVNSWKNGKLTGFWVSNNDTPEFRVLKTPSNLDRIDYLKLEERLEKQFGGKIELKDIDNGMYMLTARTRHAVVTKNTEAVCESDMYDDIVQKQHEGIRYFIANSGWQTSVLNKNGERIVDVRVSLQDDIYGVYYDLLVSGRETELQKFSEELHLDKGLCNRSAYMRAIMSEHFEDSEKIVQRINPDDVGRLQCLIYDKMLLALNTEEDARTIVNVREKINNPNFSAIQIKHAQTMRYMRYERIKLLSDFILNDEDKKALEEDSAAYYRNKAEDALKSVSKIENTIFQDLERAAELGDLQKSLKIHEEKIEKEKTSLLKKLQEVYANPHSTRIRFDLKNQFKESIRKVFASQDSIPEDMLEDILNHTYDELLDFMDELKCPVSEKQAKRYVKRALMRDEYSRAGNAVKRYNLSENTFDQLFVADPKSWAYSQIERMNVSVNPETKNAALDWIVARLCRTTESLHLIKNMVDKFSCADSEIYDRIRDGVYQNLDKLSAKESVVILDKVSKRMKKIKICTDNNLLEDALVHFSREKRNYLALFQLMHYFKIPVDEVRSKYLPAELPKEEMKTFLENNYFKKEGRPIPHQKIKYAFELGLLSQDELKESLYQEMCRRINDRQRDSAINVYARVKSGKFINTDGVCERILQEHGSRLTDMQKKYLMKHSVRSDA